LLRSQVTPLATRRAARARSQTRKRARTGPSRKLRSIVLDACGYRSVEAFPTHAENQNAIRDASVAFAAPSPSIAIVYGWRVSAPCATATRRRMAELMKPWHTRCAQRDDRQLSAVPGRSLQYAPSRGDAADEGSFFVQDAARSLGPAQAFFAIGVRCQ